jgi:hypothetical protein
MGVVTGPRPLGTRPNTRTREAVTRALHSPSTRAGNACTGMLRSRRTSADTPPQPRSGMPAVGPSGIDGLPEEKRARREARMRSRHRPLVLPALPGGLSPWYGEIRPARGNLTPQALFLGPCSGRRTDCHARLDELVQVCVAQPPSAGPVPRHSGGPLCHTGRPIESALTRDWRLLPIPPPAAPDLRAYWNISCDGRHQLPVRRQPGEATGRIVEQHKLDRLHPALRIVAPNVKAMFCAVNSAFGRNTDDRAGLAAAGGVRSPSSRLQTAERNDSQWLT